MHNKEIGLKLKEIRKKHHVTQASLAHDLGISRSALANIECGLRMPNLKYLYQYQRIFNLNKNFLDDLMPKNNFVVKNCFDISLLNCQGTKCLYDYYLTLINNEEYLKKS